MSIADSLLIRGENEDEVKARELLEEARSEYQDMGADGVVDLVDDKLNAIL